MKCKECRKFLKYHYYDIGGRALCGRCAFELGITLNEFKVLIKPNERRLSR